MPVNVDEFIKDWLLEKYTYSNLVYKLPHQLLRQMLIRYHEVANTEQSLPVKGIDEPPKQDGASTPSGRS